MISHRSKPAHVQKASVSGRAFAVCTAELTVFFPVRRSDRLPEQPQAARAPPQGLCPAGASFPSGALPRCAGTEADSSGCILPFRGAFTFQHRRPCRTRRFGPPDGSRHLRAAAAVSAKNILSSACTAAGARLVSPFRAGPRQSACRSSRPVRPALRSASTPAG